MIPFLDLPAQHRALKDEILEAVGLALDSAAFILGPETLAFEEEFATYCGTAYAVGVNSGTSALHLALLAAGVGPGDEVITVPFTFIATAAAVSYTGAKPVFVDIDPRTCCMDPTRIEDAITSRTKVIIPVHLYGHPADMDPILEIAARRGLTVIEDAAQAHGAKHKGRTAGSMGRLGCFSFYPGKNLGACGEGGAVVTDDPELARTLRMLRDWGQERKYHHELLGFNYRMEGLQAAALRIKLRRLEQWTEARRSRAALYDALLADSGVALPYESPDCRHARHVYAIRHARRDELQQYLADAGIQTGVHYPIPVHLQKAYAQLGHSAGDFPVSERAASETLSLPLYPELRDEAVAEVCEAVRRQLSHYDRA